MMYFYNERYLLPLSHDEVVHGKATILQKMNVVAMCGIPRPGHVSVHDGPPREKAELYGE